MIGFQVLAPLQAYAGDTHHAFMGTSFAMHSGQQTSRKGRRGGRVRRGGGE